MAAKPTTIRIERWNFLRSSYIDWLTVFAATIERITGESGFWLWVYLIAVVFAAVGIYATFAWIF